MDIYSDDAAEALLLYVGQNEIFEDFCVKNQIDEISILEYVVNYRLEDFKKWCLSEYGITNMTPYLLPVM